MIGSLACSSGLAFVFIFTFDEDPAYIYELFQPANEPAVRDFPPRTSQSVALGENGVGGSSASVSPSKIRSSMCWIPWRRSLRMALESFRNTSR